LIPIPFPVRLLSYSNVLFQMSFAAGPLSFVILGAPEIRRVYQ
jgi:hypothetical protein